MHIKNFLFPFACIFALCSLGSPIRDDMAGRNTDFSAGVPNAAFVEYLESDYDQYIDIYPQTGNEKNVRVECAFLVVGSASSNLNFLFCPSNTDGNSGPRIIAHTSLMQIRLSCDWSGSLRAANLKLGSKYNLTAEFSSDNTIAWSVNQSSGMGTRTFYILGNRYFSIFQGTNYRYNFHGRIYYFRLYIDGVLVRDLLPVRIGDVGYMYDTLTGDLLANQGTTDFIVGPDITPLDL